MGELESLARVWVVALASLVYVYAVVARLPKSVQRLIASLPVACLFLKLPWLFSSFLLRTISCFYLVWLCNFRLLLFCFDAGPLAEHRDSLLRFLAFAILPIKAQQHGANPVKQPPHLLRTVANLAAEAVVMLLCLRAYNHREELPHPGIIIFIYAVHMMVTADALFVAAAVVARLCLGVELEPQFNRPFLSTSIRDFWARRWNLVVSSTLRISVYNPVREALSAVVGRKRARDAGLVAAFVVSGLMHEVMLYYMTGQAPTWEWTAFFSLHGLIAAVEEWLEKELGRGLVGRLPEALKVGMTLTVLFCTGTWLFFPPVTRNGLDLKTASEIQEGARFLAQRLLDHAAANETALQF